MNSKSIKYLLFGIGMMLLAILCNNFYKGIGEIEGGFLVSLIYAIIPYAAMVAGFIALIKGLVTKE